MYCKAGRLKYAILRAITEISARGFQMETEENNSIPLKKKIAPGFAVEVQFLPFCLLMFLLLVYNKILLS